nr:nucleoside diphosphate kinase, mitochondrial isoform X3 [Symphalangus syndactylus]XP_055098226.1 nucleoside diphosphate kinase, mitochondrial isoform X3 [Symphalangus syndactylus]XP_055098227.1 nucleoside diphosphate kinase, mitochondrial isoform X3 [Symphalangus syndactylus]XP_055098228.1 nucleoside diphosphate kinase, mitochondrial isoform X3 [Symphalangus syndactylus]
MKMLQAPESVLAEHYQDLQRKPFYPALIRYMSSGPVVAMVWEGYNVVRASRAMIGHTDSAEAAPGTIRGDFSVHISRNVIHASDSVEGAQREIQLWFQSSELDQLPLSARTQAHIQTCLSQTTYFLVHLCPTPAQRSLSHQLQCLSVPQASTRLDQSFLHQSAGQPLWWGGLHVIVTSSLKGRH